MFTYLHAVSFNVYIIFAKRYLEATPSAYILRLKIKLNLARACSHLPKCPCDVIPVGHLARKKHNHLIKANMDFRSAGVYDDPGQV